MTPTWMEQAVAIGSTAPQRIFHINPMGRLANQMIQYMVALKFASMVPGCSISNVNLPQWDIRLPELPWSGRSLEVRNPLHRLDLRGLADRMLSGDITRIDFWAYGQRMENLLGANSYRDAFKAPGLDELQGYDERHLVCSVRTGDILTGEHPPYTLLPVAYYAQLAEMTGLRLVFLGETGPSSYVDLLRSAFPEAIFPRSAGVLEDFETIRRSRNIAVSVSTFSWLAAWLSEAKTIFLPVNGLLNPRQNETMLLPYDDPRYRFILFPVNYAVPENEFQRAHESLAPYWRELPGKVLSRLVEGPTRFEWSWQVAKDSLDPEFYVQRYSDLTDVFGADWFAGSTHHYQFHGFYEDREPFRLDVRWYASSYPMAAFEVAQGDFANFWHHYIVVGRRRGYRPFPP